MKKLFILAVASVIGGTAFSQTSTTPSGVKFGIKAGVNLPKYQFQDNGGTDPETKTTTNFHVTGFVDAPISPIFSVQPGISLQGKGGKFYDNESSSSNTRVQFEQNTLWLEVPVNLVGHIPVASTANIYLGAGPYAAFGISGKNKYTVGNTTNEPSINFGSDSGDDLKGTDFGLNFIGGVQLNSGFNLGAGYGLGLTDLRPTGDGGNGKQTNRVWSFSVGYAF